MELHKAATPWNPKREAVVEGLTAAEQETQELYRKFQSILNKLTPQKFQSLAEQALKLEINSEERLKGAIDKIFTKVVTPASPRPCRCLTFPLPPSGPGGAQLQHRLREPVQGSVPAQGGV